MTVPTDEPVPSTSRGPERITRSRGRGYGILGPDYAAEINKQAYMIELRNSP